MMQNAHLSEAREAGPFFREVLPTKL